MGAIYLVGVGARAHRLDLMAPCEGGHGYRNVLPGYHEVLVRGDGVWHGAGFVLAPEGVAALRLDCRDGGATLVDARGSETPPREALVDVLARDVAAARAWQAATSAITSVGAPLDGLADDPLRRLQASFVRYALHHDEAAAATVLELARELVAHAGDWRAAADMGRALAGMVRLSPSLAARLPLEDAIGALSEVGVDRDDAELIGAAHALQVVVHG